MVAAWAAAVELVSALGRIAKPALGALWQAVKVPLLGLLNILAALVVLFEEWGWRPLAELLGFVARLRIVARLERWIAGLPPYGALLVFALPTTILFPVKLIGLWLLAKGQALAAGATLVVAKVASTALVARIFMLTKPALMRISWFAWAYGKFMPWKEEVFAKIRASWAWRYGRMVKTAMRLEAMRAWLRWKPVAAHQIARARSLLRSTVLGARLLGRQVWREIRARLAGQ